MKFRLRTLLVLVTICGIAAAIILHILNHREKLRVHRIAFDEASESVKFLDDELEAFILQMPEVRRQLLAMDPINPEISLAHSINSSSYSVGGPRFTRDYHYDWQRADGSRDEGIKIYIESKLAEGSLDKHVIRLTHAPDDLSTEVARWVAEKLEQLPAVRVELATLEDGAVLIRED
ncbi:MAG: hypothetical protein KDB00_18100 [Planctomycetales bacterium]|nr:hypothetical protein [Planctomycetales bacterium]